MSKPWVIIVSRNYLNDIYDYRDLYFMYYTNYIKYYWLHLVSKSHGHVKAMNNINE